MASVHVFGIRHHGPGSARSLLAALEALQPDLLLVEGPPDAVEALPLLVHPEMQPPVALLVYGRDDPRRAAFYPFTHFSPEWQALRHALAHNIPARLIDLPASQALALSPEEEDAFSPLPAEESVQNPGQEAALLERQPPLPDPLTQLALAAGYSDGEQLWELLVEQRQDSRDLFAAILEMIAAVREQWPDDPETARREAAMRQQIRAAQKEGFERIAVVCGAWHAPVLLPANWPGAGHDRALLKGLKRIPVTVTWVPWTYSRLSRFSGYGAGITSPGWYNHLWQYGHDEGQRLATVWLTRVARLLRGEGLGAAPAQVIDAVRLAEALAALRGRTLPGLPELNEAALAVFCQGDETPLSLITERLIVGVEMGAVPGDSPTVSLQADLQQQQKRLRLKAEAGESTLKLDLRKPLHLERSHLLHRLLLLGVPWGRKEAVGQRGTFNELWRLRWQPELTLLLVEKSGWGNTVALAAAAYARHQASAGNDLGQLTRLTHDVLLADLPEAVPAVVERLQTVAALTGDVAALMDSLPPLVEVLRYGNVRTTATDMVGAVVDGMVVRTCVGLPAAATALAGDAAAGLFGQFLAFHRALLLLENEEHSERWFALLADLLPRDAIHPLLRGRAARILLDAGRLPLEEVVRQLRLGTAAAIDPTLAAAWLEGFLRDSGQVLLHHHRLLQVADLWLSSLSDEQFIGLLPLLRRTFATFPAPERRQLGQLLASNRYRRPDRTDTGQPFAGWTLPTLDETRANAVLPMLARLLGVSNSGEKP